MKNVMGRVLLTIGTWAFVYALPAVPLEGLPNLGVRLPAWAYEVDIWPQALGIPGAIAGAVFLALLAITGHARRYENCGTGWLAVRGAVSGLIAGGILLVIRRGEPLVMSMIIVGGAAVLGALAAPASAFVLRFLARRGQSPAGAHA